ncbi:hypothetical protein V2L06_18630 [Pseudomonas alliivorans]|nr:hypothetical protein [Pseudomonas alliivorans]
MVNFSEVPVFLVDDSIIHECVLKNIKVISRYIDEVYGVCNLSYDAINSAPDKRYYAFKKFFVYSPNLLSRIYDKAWVLSAYEYVLLGDLNASQELVNSVLGQDSRNYYTIMKVNLRRSLWLLLVLLFKDGCLLLTPLMKANQFKHKSPVHKEFGFEHYPELMAFTMSARDKVNLPSFWEDVDQRVRERVAQYGTRLFWIIGAVKPEDLTIEKLVAVHKKYYYENERLTAELPVHTIVNYVCGYFGARVCFDYPDLYHALNELRPNKYKTGARGELTSIDFNPVVESAKSSEEIVDYCRLLVRTKFMPESILHNPILSETGFYNTPTLLRWVAVQKSYMEMKAYEQETNGALGSGIFNIYLFVYLDKWFSLFGEDSDVEYPEFISQLSIDFVAPLTRDPNSPLPLENFIHELTDGAPSIRSSALQQLRAMFEWMEMKGFEDEHGKFKNHLSKLDMPPSMGLSSSDKRPFKRAEYSLAINYLYCVFQATKILNDDILESTYTDILHGDLEQRALALGWCNEFYHGGRQYKVDVLPKCFFKRWSIPLANGASKTIFSPHMVVHALSAVESGLRHQSIQWLSTDFDKHVIGDVELNKAYWLHVVIDKVKKAPIRTIVSGQTILALRYQREIRSMVSSDAFKKTKSYENREDNVRANYLPLFSKSTVSGDPYSDGLYSETYVSFLVSFQFFLKAHGVQCKFFECKPSRFGYGETVIPGDVVVLNVHTPYCPVRIVTDMTPHHTRNSTVKVWQRIMKDSEVGRFKTGQGVRTVRYYGTLIDEDYEEIADKVGSDLAKVWSGERLDASSPSSNFRKALACNPSLALRDFACITMSPESSLKKSSALDDLVKKHDERLSHHSTHVCTKGGKCTEAIIREGLEYRCGLCIFSVKGIDHIPAIDAKIYNLSVEVEELHAYADTLSEENIYELERVDERLEKTVSDLLGWTWSRDYLVECYRRDVSSSKKLFSIQPELMKKHMCEVEMEDQSIQYIFSKLYENSLYPELQNDVVRAKYNFLKMRLQGDSSDVKNLFKPVIVDAASAIVGQVKTLLESNNLSLDNIALALEFGADIALDEYSPLILISNE